MNFLKTKTFKLLPIVTAFFIAFFCTNTFSMSCESGFTEDELSEIRKKTAEGDAGAMSEFLTLAKLGSGAIQLEVGLNYLNGKNGFPKSSSKAKKWFELAAKQESAEAQFNLGLLNELKKEDSISAIGRFYQATLQDHKKAPKYIQLYADRGDALAQFFYSRMLEEGIGVENNPDKSKTLYEPVSGSITKVENNPDKSKTLYEGVIKKASEVIEGLVTLSDEQGIPSSRKELVKLANKGELLAQKELLGLANRETIKRESFHGFSTHTREGQEWAQTEITEAAEQGHEWAREALTEAAKQGQEWAQTEITEAAKQGQEWAQTEIIEAAKQGKEWAREALREAAIQGQEWAQEIRL